MLAVELTEEFRWRGRRIAWGRAGSGPAVVFCHGTPFSSLLWRPFAEALLPDHTVYLWDLPGYGASSQDPAHDVHFGVHADAFAALLAHWGLDGSATGSREPARPHVVAHDIGGGVALRTHLVGEVDFASLLLVDAVAVPPSGSPFFRFVQRHPGVLDQLPGYVHEAVVRGYVGNASHRGLAPDVADALVAPWLGPAGQPAFYRQIADYDERYLAENEERVGRIDIPVRILWGTADTWLPVEIGVRLHELIPGSELTLVPDAGHLVQLDAPVALADAVRGWLDRQTAAGGTPRRADP